LQKVLIVVFFLVFLVVVKAQPLNGLVPHNA